MIVIIALLFLAICYYLYLQNNLLQITTFRLKSMKIKKEFKIVHLSDLQGKRFGKNNIKLIDAVKGLKPDIIMFTGDLVSSSARDLTQGTNTLISINKIAPVYYILGNHEYGNTEVITIIKLLKAGNVRVLINKTENLKLNDTDISILGLDEISTGEKATSRLLEQLEKSKSYKIVLSHFPEKIKIYKKFDIDMMLSGHAHGGQIILPFIGGIYAPGQGLFPKYSKGIYKENNVSLIVNRGLGNSRFPFRVNNRPEITEIILTS